MTIPRYTEVTLDLEVLMKMASDVLPHLGQRDQGMPLYCHVSDSSHEVRA